MLENRTWQKRRNRGKGRRKKPWWIRLSILIVAVCLIWTFGHISKIYFGHILIQNLTTFAEVQGTEKVQIAGMSREDQIQCLQAAYMLSAEAYSPSGDMQWTSQLENAGYANIQRIENSASFLYHYFVMREKSHVGFLFSTVNATVATKQVTVDGQDKTLVAVAFRGTDVGDLVDDFSDMFTAVNKEGLHKGFVWNANNFYKQRNKIKFDLNGVQVSLGQVFEAMQGEDSPYVMLVTGHSLGAAVADVLVGNVLYENEIAASNVAAFTFGAPKSASQMYRYPHANIINVINKDDIVPTVGADRQIGQNLVFEPSEEFRARTYGQAYEIGAELGTYNDIIGAAATGFISHNIAITYQAVVNEIARNPDLYFA